MGVGGRANRRTASGRIPDFAFRASKHLNVSRLQIRFRPSTTKRLLESSSVEEHIPHVRHPPDIPLRDITVERCRAPEHIVHGRDLADVPVGDIIIERDRITERVGYVCHFPDIPLRDIAVKRFGVIKHVPHGGHLSDVPLRYVAIKPFCSGDIITPTQRIPAEQIAHVRDGGHIP